MENRGSLLYDAAVQGNLTALQELLQQDRLALDRFIVNDFSETPLHVAAMLGHLDFVKEILQRKPQLAEELDSQGFSPLHLSSAKGYVEIVKQLVMVCPDMCLARDRDGRNPLHLAATKGRVEVLRELVKEVPAAALATVGQSQTVLHLCVIHNQLEALKFLVEVMEHDEFLNAKNDYGYTILHLAVADKQIETVKYLLMTGEVEVNAVNGNGFTSLDILTQSHRDVKDFDIAEAIRAAGATRATNALHIQHSRETNHRPATKNTGIAQRTPASYTKHEHILPLASSNHNFKKPEDRLLRKRDGLMVVASLIATMAFQSGVNPPGGLWQDDSPDPNGPKAGTSILAYKFANHYFRYLTFNTTGFIASLSIIMLLITGLPFQRKFFMWLLTATIVVAITSMALTYAEAIFIFTPKNRESIVKKVIKYGVFAWAGVMALLLVFNTVRLIALLSNNLMPKRRKVQMLPSQSVYAS